MKCAAVNYAADKSRIRCASAMQGAREGPAPAPPNQLRRTCHASGEPPFADRPNPEQHTEYLTVARAIYQGRVSQYPGPAGHAVRPRSCYGEERPARDDAVKPVESTGI